MKRWFVGLGISAILFAHASCVLLAAGAVESGNKDRARAVRQERERQHRCRELCAEQFAEEPARRALCEDDCAKARPGG